jgi:EmrB/QacA subfamily drug resistance transporter
MSEILPDPRRWLALVVLLAGAFLPSFDFFVVNVALPSLQTELGARPSQLQFVVAGYALGFAVLLVTGGRLGDLYGRKRLFMVGMAGFTMASALCGLAPTPNVLIAARVLQGLTAALMNPQVLAIIRVTFPEGERSRAIGYFSTTLGLASIAAQLVGGALIEANFAGLSWRPIFLVNVPIGAVALVASHYLLQESRAVGRPSLDLGGIGIGSVALMLLIYPLVEGREAGWPVWAWIALVLSVPALAGFVLYELILQQRGRAPLVSIRLFRDPGFSFGLIMCVTFFGGLSAFFMCLTVTLQDGLGFGPLATGLVFVAFGIGFVAGSILSARVARVIGPRTISLGTLLMGGGLAAVIALFRLADGAAPSEWLLWPVLALYGVGQGLALPTLVASVVGSSRIPPQEAGAASGVFSMIQQVAFTLGIAVVVGLFFTRLGATPDSAAYEAALSVALGCNAGLMALTCVLAFAMPRGRVAVGPNIHLD